MLGRVIAPSALLALALFAAAAAEAKPRNAALQVSAGDGAPNS